MVVLHRRCVREREREDFWAEKRDDGLLDTIGRSGLNELHRAIHSGIA